MKYKTNAIYQLENLSEEDRQTALCYQIPSGIDWCWESGIVKASENSKEWMWIGRKSDGRWEKWNCSFKLKEN